MTRPLALRLITAAAAFAVTSACSAAEETGAASGAKQAELKHFNEAQAGEIENVVRAFLLENPDVLIDSLNVYRERQAAADAEQMRAMEERFAEGARENLDALVAGEGAFAAGADVDNAKIAVVEFFDYHCGFCKNASGLVQDLVKEDPAVKVVFRELPILRRETGESRMAATYAIAARDQGKYADLHFALMDLRGVITEDRVKKAAKKAGLDVDALKAARKKPGVENAIEETTKLADDLGVDGTPSFVVATVDGEFVEVFPGYRPDAILDAIERAKKAL